jgi:hypothetical protein
MTMPVPVEQGTAMDVVIMTIITIIQTAPCQTSIEDSLQVQVLDHVLWTRRMPHCCQEKLSASVDISTTKMTIPTEWRPRPNNPANHHSQIASQEVRLRSPRMHYSSWQRFLHRYPTTAIHSHTRSPWTAHNETTGHEPWKKTEHRSCSKTHSQLSTSGKQSNCESWQSAPDGSSRRSIILMPACNTQHA